MILSGDIGGTKSLFGLFDGDRLIFQRRFNNADFADFAAVLAALRQDPELQHGEITDSCFAIAGPLSDDQRQARMTNLAWPVIDADAIAARSEFGTVRLVNDFAAAALGAVTSDARHLVTLQAGKPLAAAPRLVIGAGTGLGMATVLPRNGGWQILPGEGGHLGFAPSTEQDIELWRFLANRHTRVTWERAVSGPGLAAIHAFLGGGQSDEDPGSIGEAGVAEPGSLAGQALDMFCTLYGRYAGDMAQAILPRGGIYLAGGIATKILPTLGNGRFIAAFNDKAHHARLVADMPIYVATDPHLALRGAAQLATEAAVDLDQYPTITPARESTV
jgi:glucokinase